MISRKAIIATKRWVSSPTPRKWVSSTTNIGSGAKIVKDTVGDWSNPRTVPRAAVLAGAGALFAYMTYKKAIYQEHEIDDRKNVINEQVPPKPTEVTKSVADNMPNVMNAQRYDSLRKEGLGVEHEEWKKKKNQA